MIEIQTQWSITDLQDAHEALDVKYELECAAIEDAKRKAQRNDR